MNALRQFVTASDSDSVLITLPPEYRQQRLEIIVLPLEDAIIPVDKYYLENMDKFQQKQGNSQKLIETMNKVGDEAIKSGLTEQILTDILNDPA